MSVNSGRSYCLLIAVGALCVLVGSGLHQWLSKLEREQSSRLKSESNASSNRQAAQSRIGIGAQANVSVEAKGNADAQDTRQSTSPRSALSSETEETASEVAERAGDVLARRWPLWQGRLPGELLESVVEPSPDRNRLTRISLVQVPGFGEPLRVEQGVEVDPKTGEEDVVSISEMAAKHFLVKRSRSHPETALEKIASDLGGALRKHPTRPRLYSLELAEATVNGVPEALDSLIRQAGDAIEYAEPDHLLHARAVLPNDPQFDEQWGLNNTGQFGGAPDADIEAPEGWAAQHDASDIVVAVIDSGIRTTHEDLSGNLWRNGGEVPADGLDNDNNGYVDDVHGVNVLSDDGRVADDNGHGTAVAGVLGALGDNGVGIAGVAWDIRIMSIKFLNQAGFGGLVSDEIEAIDYARKQGADIVNASFGSRQFSRSEFEAIRDLRKAGIPFVAAAGNAGTDNDQSPHEYPAGYELDNIVSVASINRNGELSSFSNFGAFSVDIAAPGESIFSTAGDSDTAYSVRNGTSFAVPHVAGILAILQSTFPNEDYLSAIHRLYASARQSGELEEKVRMGGWPNVAAALALDSVPQLPEITHFLREISVPPRARGALVGEDVVFDIEASGGADLNYQWRKDGMTIQGTDSGTLRRSGVSLSDAGVYRAVVRDELGVASSMVELEVRQPDIEIAEALEADELKWLNWGDARWLSQSEITTDGEDAAASGPLGNREVSQLRTRVGGPAEIGFWWRVSSEEGFDFLRFYIDGNEMAAISGETQGEKSFKISQGEHELVWAYEKDQFTSHGRDQGYIDDFTVIAEGSLPTISPIADQSIPVNGLLGPIDFEVSDSESLASEISVSATSANQAVVANRGIEVSGSGRSRSLTIRPVADRSGEAGITVRAQDPSGAVKTESFTLQVGEIMVRKLTLSDKVGHPGERVLLPVRFQSRGDENAIGISIAYDPGVLSDPTFEMGEAIDEATLLMSPQEAGDGLVGAAVSLPAGETFAEGRYDLLMAEFTVRQDAASGASTISFADTPLQRKVSSSEATSLSAVYENGLVVVTRGIEGDVVPRSEKGENGDGRVTITDWVQVGRFVTGLDEVESPEQFIRADTAPRNEGERSVNGDGRLTIRDWVQVGRYATGLDPVQPAGGPLESSEATPH